MELDGLGDHRRDDVEQSDVGFEVVGLI